MPRLPRISGREVRRAFERAGWTYARTRGDHMILGMQGRRPLAVPDYSIVPPYILSGLLRTADLTIEEFTALL